MRWVLALAVSAGLLLGTSGFASDQDLVHLRQPEAPELEGTEPVPLATQEPPPQRFRLYTPQEKSVPTPEPTQADESVPDAVAPIHLKSPKTENRDSEPPPEPESKPQRFRLSTIQKSAPTPVPSSTAAAGVPEEGSLLHLKSPKVETDDDDDYSIPAQDPESDSQIVKLVSPEPSQSPQAPPKAASVPSPLTGDALKFKEVKAPEPEPPAPRPVTVRPEDVYLDYTFPRLSFYFDYRPGYFSITQTLTSGATASTAFNFSSYAPFSIAFGSTYEISPRLSIQAAFSVATYTAAANNLAFYTLNQSSTTILLATLTPYYCFRPGASLLQICPGVGLGVDGFPIMEFEQNNGLSLNSFEDMIVRATVKFAYPLTRLTTAELRLGLDDGLLDSASSGIQVTSHRTYWGQVALSTQQTPKLGFLTGVRVEQKDTQFQQAPDSWSDSATTYLLFLGVDF